MATKKQKPTAAADESSNSEFDLLKRETLGRYQLKRKLGAGGMGAVYLALDSQLNRLVALKVLPPDKAENEILVKRFKSEAQAVAQLRHENIVQVYESGETEGYHYIALEYVEGTDVHRLIKKRGRLPVRRATEIITQVAQALDHAEKKGIVHRDIKPANMLINQAGVVKLTDMGLARMLDDTEVTSITRAGTTVGTVDYMAPEQARSSKAADTRSDIYSLGCAWYHMLTGSPPYAEGSVTNKLQAHAIAPIPDPRSINESVPESVVAVLQRMMAKRPEDRHQTPQELLDDLKAVKASKKDISATDLAALAAEAEESPPPRSRAREERARDDEDDDLPVSSGAGSSVRSGTKKPNSSGSPIDALPPRERRALDDVPASEKKGFNTEPLVYIGLACGLAVAVGVTWYLISSIGGAMSPASNKQVNLIDLAQQQQEERAAEGGDQATAATTEQSPQAMQTVENGNGRTADAVLSRENLNGNGTNAKLVQAIENKWPVIAVVNPSVRTDEASAHSITEALAKTPAKEMVIQLRTTGVHRWEQPIIIDGRSLIITKSAESPGTILVNTTGALANGLITIRRGDLVLENLHFGLLGYDLPGENELTLIKSLDGNVMVKSCSFTQEETRAGAVTLCSIAQTFSNSLNCVWERSLIRGPMWRPFEISASRVKFLLQSCLVCVGDEPVLTLNHTTSRGGTSPGADQGELTKRDLAFADSLVLCQGTPLTFTNTTREVSVPPTQLRMNRTSFVARTQSAETPFLRIIEWPENVLATAGNGKLSQINWISENSQFAGWSRRLQATANKTRTAFEAMDDQAWQEFWGNPGLTGSWNAKGLADVPRGSLEFADIASLRKLGLATAALPGDETLQQLEQLKPPLLPEQSWRSTMARSTETGKISPTPFPADAPRLTVDATKVNLGEFLASQELPDVVVVEVRGFGLRSCAPIRIRGKKVRLEIQQEAGRAPLTFRPVPGKGDAPSKSTPWIVVENGTLEISGGVYRLEPYEKNAMPEVWLDALNANIQLQRCFVRGPLLANPALKSLIRIQGSGNPRGLAVVEDSYLEYGGAIVDADLASHDLRLQNSIMVSQTHLLQVKHRGEEAAPGRVELARNTFSGRNGVMHFDVAAPKPHGKPFVNVYVTKSVFVQAVAVEKGAITPTTIVSATFGSEELPRRVWWWGTRNGFSPEVTKLFKQQDLAGNWIDFWGVGHVKEPLLANDGVLLREAVIDAKKLRPASFSLFEQCQAMKWGEGETPLGADWTQLDLLRDTETETKPGETKPVGATAPPRF